MTPDLGWIAAPALLLGLATVAAFLRKRAGAPSSDLAVEERLVLGPGRTLWTVRAGKRRFLLAGTGKETTLIAELDPGENARERVESPQRSAAAAPSSF